MSNINNWASEHQGVSYTLKVNSLTVNVQFAKVRKNNILTSANLMPLVEANERLQSVFSVSDPELIAEILIDKMDKIVNSVAPFKVVQLDRKDRLNVTRETREIIRHADDLVTNATNTLETEDFRAAKRAQNYAKTCIKNDQKEKLKKSFVFW